MFPNFSCILRRYGRRSTATLHTGKDSQSSQSLCTQKVVEPFVWSPPSQKTLLSSIQTTWLKMSISRFCRKVKGFCFVNFLEMNNITISLTSLSHYRHKHHLTTTTPTTIFTITSTTTIITTTILTITITTTTTLPRTHQVSSSQGGCWTLRWWRTGNLNSQTVSCHNARSSATTHKWAVVEALI